jgi:AcrR family transcriptional regulator
VRSKGIYAKGEARREEILRGTKEVLARGGYRNISLRLIGEALGGIESAHILYYFSSREELLQCTLQQWDDEVIADHPRMTQPEYALDEFALVIKKNLETPGLVHLYLTFAAEAIHPDHTAHDFFQRRFEWSRGLLRAAIESEQHSGRISAHLDCDLEARKLIAISDGLLLQALIDDKVDAPGDLAIAIEQLRASATPDLQNVGVDRPDVAG